MTSKNYAPYLEKLLDDEFKHTAPIAVISNTLIAYKNYKIKKTSANDWQLILPNNDPFGTFKLKVAAILAASYHSKQSYDELASVRELDGYYWNSLVDSILFKERIAACKNSDRLDVYYARWTLTSAREAYYRATISKLFRSEF
jgi:hypothetical protein